MLTVVNGSVLFLLVFLGSWELCTAYVPISPAMRSFSNAIKGGRLPPGEEYVLYVSNTGEPGVITEQWYTGKHNHVCFSLNYRTVQEIHEYTAPPTES